jgi:cell division protein FtsB
VKKLLRLLKNKFIITFGIFFFYLILIDDNDIFYVVNQKKKLNDLELQNDAMKAKLQQTKRDLKKISHLDYLEAYAREKKFFKRNDEDIFVITND